MKKRSFIVLLVLVFTLGFAVNSIANINLVDSMEFQGDETKLSLENAIEIVLEDSPDVKKVSLDLDEAQVDYDKYERDLRNAKRAFGQKEETSLDYLQYVKLLELSGEYSMENAKRNYDATVEKVKSDIEQTYFNVLHAEQLVDINKANLDITKDLLEKTKKKFDLGLIAKQEVIDSELNLIKAENQYKSSINSLKKAKMSLNILLNYDVMTLVSLDEELTYKEFEIESIGDAISKALLNRNEIKAAEFSYELAKVNMDITEKLYSDFMYEYREKKLAFEKAVKDLEDTKKTIELDVRSNYLDVLQKQDEVKAGEKSVELAEEALRLSQLSYDVGMSVLTDVQKAQTGLLQAKLGLSQAILDYNLAVLKFEDSIGVGRTSMPGASQGGF